MAINPTGAIYKTLNFDGKSSGTYGVYITGDAVFNAPERDVEMIEIPGRNGAFALDKGRFQNIEVTYPAGIFAETEADFAEAISDFRNYLCSRKGYCRLSDDYNPNEYRLGIYKSGLEVDPAFLKAGKFNITFECKPQRWLSSGEVAVAVSSGDTITNPTLFPSSPLLEIEGYGTIEFNGYEIELDDDLVGDVLFPGENVKNNLINLFFPNTYINTGDTIDADVATANSHFSLKQSVGSNVASATLQSWSGDSTTAPNVSRYYNVIIVDFNLDASTFLYGTPSELRVDCNVRVVFQNSNVADISPYFKCSYDGNKTITWEIGGGNTTYGLSGASAITSGDITIHSTATTYGHPTMIDCDLGEAYADDNGVISSLNSYIDLGSDLPELAPGSNTVTFDNTITQLKITPRWWKV